MGYFSNWIQQHQAHRRYHEVRCLIESGDSNKIREFFDSVNPEIPGLVNSTKDILRFCIARKLLTEEKFKILNCNLSQSATTSESVLHSIFYDRYLDDKSGDGQPLSQYVGQDNRNPIDQAPYKLLDRSFIPSQVPFLSELETPLLSLQHEILKKDVKDAESCIFSFIAEKILEIYALGKEAAPKLQEIKKYLELLKDFCKDLLVLYGAFRGGNAEPLEIVTENGCPRLKNPVPTTGAATIRAVIAGLENAVNGVENHEKGLSLVDQLEQNISFLHLVAHSHENFLNDLQLLDPIGGGIPRREMVQSYFRDGLYCDGSVGVSMLDSANAFKLKPTYLNDNMFLYELPLFYFFPGFANPMQHFTDEAQGEDKIIRLKAFWGVVETEGVFTIPNLFEFKEDSNPSSSSNARRHFNWLHDHLLKQFQFEIEKFPNKFPFQKEKLNQFCHAINKVNFYQYKLINVTHMLVHFQQAQSAYGFLDILQKHHSDIVSLCKSVKNFLTQYVESINNLIKLYEEGEKFYIDNHVKSDVRNFEKFQHSISDLQRLKEAITQTSEKFDFYSHNIVFSNKNLLKLTRDAEKSMRQFQCLKAEFQKEFPDSHAVHKAPEIDAMPPQVEDVTNGTALLDEAPASGVAAPSDEASSSPIVEQKNPPNSLDIFFLSIYKACYAAQGRVKSQEKWISGDFSLGQIDELFIGSSSRTFFALSVARSIVIDGSNNKLTEKQFITVFNLVYNRTLEKTRFSSVFGMFSRGKVNNMNEIMQRAERKGSRTKIIFEQLSRIAPSC